MPAVRVSRATRHALATVRGAAAESFMPVLRAVHGDITSLTVDAVVNAANATLLGGGGVDGAIHRAAGPQLLEACRKLGGCAPGDAKITPGYRLQARYVIHTVGPVWTGGQRGEAQLLASCYRKSLALAARHALHSLAFPSISTGAYRFPIELAASVAVTTVRQMLTGAHTVEDTAAVRDLSSLEVIFCCYSRADLAIYQQLLRGDVAAPGREPR